MSHQGRFDGITVDQFQARFAGTFDVDDYDAMHQAIDGEVMFLVVARVKSATITETSSGDIRRTNSLKLQQIKAVRQQVDREALADQFGLDLPLQLPLQATSSVVDPPAALPTPAPKLPVIPDAEADTFDRVPVGGAGVNDNVLAKFLDVDA